MTIKMNAIKKIVVLGPESSGKTTLCQSLASYYKTEWCPEFAREYLLKNGIKYALEDLLTIARGQIEIEDTYTMKVFNSSNPNSLLFIDTDMYVMKVWCELVFGTCHQYILNQIAERKYNLYLLCKPDFPWVKDQLREYPDIKIREKIYHIYKDLLINQSVPWIELSGSEKDRLQKAIEKINII